MTRPPRNPAAHLLHWRLIVAGLTQGLCVLLATALTYSIALTQDIDTAVARAQAFSVIVASNIGLILVNRTRHRNALHALTVRNRAFWWISGGALSGLTLTIYLPALAHLFRFAPLDALQVVSAALAAFAGLAMYEIGRKIYLLSYNRLASVHC